MLNIVGLRTCNIRENPYSQIVPYEEELGEGGGDEGTRLTKGQLCALTHRWRKKGWMQPR